MNDVVIGDRLGVIHKKHQNTHEPRNLMHCNCGHWPKEASRSPGSAAALPGPASPDASSRAHSIPCRWSPSPRRECWLLPGVAWLWGTYEAVYMLQSILLQYRTKQKWKGGVWGWLSIWIFSSGFPSMKRTVASINNKAVVPKEERLLAFPCPWMFTGSSWLLGVVGWQSGEMFCVCTVYAAALMNDMVWFGLFRSPLVNSLCSFSFVLRN